MCGSWAKQRGASWGTMEPSQECYLSLSIDSQRRLSLLAGMNIGPTPGLLSTPRAVHLIPLEKTQLLELCVNCPSKSSSSPQAAPGVTLC